MDVALPLGTGLSGRLGNVLTSAGADAKPGKARKVKVLHAAVCPPEKKASVPS